MTIEQLAEKIFTECAKDGEPVTKEESLEMARMELGAKSIKNYTLSDVNKPKSEKKEKIVKVSDEKSQIFNDLYEFLSEKYSIQVKKENKLLEINLNGKNFKLDLIETRQKS